MINKFNYKKVNNKKILHKVKKHWEIVSIALLGAVGGGALASSTLTNASANQNQSNQNNDPSANVSLNQTPVHQTQQSSGNQSQSNTTTLSEFVNQHQNNSSANSIANNANSIANQYKFSPKQNSNSVGQISNRAKNMTENLMAKYVTKNGTKHGFNEPEINRISSKNPAVTSKIHKDKNPIINLYENNYNNRGGGNTASSPIAASSEATIAKSNFTTAKSYASYANRLSGSARQSAISQAYSLDNKAISEINSARSDVDVNNDNASAFNNIQSNAKTNDDSTISNNLNSDLNISSANSQMVNTDPTNLTNTFTNVNDPSNSNVNNLNTSLSVNSSTSNLIKSESSLTNSVSNYTKSLANSISNLASSTSNSDFKSALNSYFNQTINDANQDKINALNLNRVSHENSVSNESSLAASGAQNISSKVTSINNDVKAISSNVSAGIIKAGKWGSAQYKLYKDGTLYLYNGLIGHNVNKSDTSDSDVNDISDAIGAYDTDLIKVIKVNSDVTAPNDSANLFDDLPNLQTFTGNLNTSDVVNMSNMFTSDSNLTNLNLGNQFNTHKVNNMNGMFMSDSRLSNLNLGNQFNTSKVSNMSNMFASDSSLTNLSLGNQFNTENVSDMAYMFASDSSLTNLDVVNQFNTGNVKSMNNMFEGDYKLPKLNLSNFNTSNVNNMNGMFASDFNLSTLNLSNLSTNNVKEMNNMFKSDYTLSNLNLGGKFSTSNVTNMHNMFASDSVLSSLDLSNFNTDKVSNMNDMFKNDYQLAHLKLGPQTELWNAGGLNALPGAAFDWYYRPDNTQTNLSSLLHPKAGWYDSIIFTPNNNQVIQNANNETNSLSSYNNVTSTIADSAANHRYQSSFSQSFANYASLAQNVSYYNSASGNALQSAVSAKQTNVSNVAVAISAAHADSLAANSLNDLSFGSNENSSAIHSQIISASSAASLDDLKANAEFTLANQDERSAEINENIVSSVSKDMNSYANHGQNIASTAQETFERDLNNYNHQVNSNDASVTKQATKWVSNENDSLSSVTSATTSVDNVVNELSITNHKNSLVEVLDNYTGEAQQISMSASSYGLNYQSEIAKGQVETSNAGFEESLVGSNLSEASSLSAEVKLGKDNHGHKLTQSQALSASTTAFSDYMIAINENKLGSYDYSIANSAKSAASSDRQSIILDVDQGKNIVSSAQTVLKGLESSNYDQASRHNLVVIGQASQFVNNEDNALSSDVNATSSMASTVNTLAQVNHNGRLIGNFAPYAGEIRQVSNIASSAGLVYQSAVNKDQAELSSASFNSSLAKSNDNNILSLSNELKTGKDNYDNSITPSQAHSASATIQSDSTAALDENNAASQEISVANVAKASANSARSEMALAASQGSNIMNSAKNEFTSDLSTSSANSNKIDKNKYEGHNNSNDSPSIKPDSPESENTESANHGSKSPSASTSAAEMSPDASQTNADNNAGISNASGDNSSAEVSTDSGNNNVATNTDTGSNNSRLPKTGENNSETELLGTIALLMAAIMFSFGSAVDRKRND